MYNKYQHLTYQDKVKLNAAASELSLTVRKPTPEQYKRAKEVIAKPEGLKLVHPLEPTYAARAIQLQEDWPEKINVVMQVLRIGDLGIAATPFETFTQTGDRKSVV